jgi:tetratricopeptide (TPR) repeat protein
MARNFDERLVELMERRDALREQGREIRLDELTDDPELLAALGQADADLSYMDAVLGGRPSPDEQARGIPGRYQVVAAHDGGGMGVVYRAHDTELGREVAYKVIKPHLAADRQAEARFLGEARITARLQHPGVVPVYGLSSDEDGRPAYAMRFVDGTSLLAAVEQFHVAGRHLRSRWGWPLLGHFVRVCQTIHHAHEQGILHRDLSPRNVLLVGDGETLVIDWGLASDFAGEVGEGAGSGTGGLTASRAGTAAFVAPEVFDLRIARPFSRRSDVYSLGALLFLILTGRPPFVGKSTPEVVERARGGPVPDARTVRAGVPRPLARICARAMSRDPAARYATAYELARDVEAWLAGDRVSADREPWHEGIWRRASRRPARTTAVASLALVGLVVVAAWGSVAAAGSRAALKAKEAALYREQALRNKADASIAHAIFAENLMREQAARSGPLVNGELLRALLRVLEHREEDPTLVVRSARAALKALESPGHQEPGAEKGAIRVMTAHLREGIDALEQLNREFPGSRNYRILLGRYYHLLGWIEATWQMDVAQTTKLLSGQGLSPARRTKVEGELATFDKALATLPPDEGDIRHDHFEAWRGRAYELLQLGRFTESLLAWDRALGFADEIEVGGIGWYRPIVLKGAEIEQGQMPWSRPPHIDHAKAMEWVESIVDREGVSPDAIYNAACVFALAGADSSAAVAERQRRCDRAVAYLERIAKVGYFRPKLPRILSLLRPKDPINLLLTDPDLNALRDRADFRALTERVSRPSGPPTTSGAPPK